MAVFENRLGCLRQKIVEESLDAFLVTTMANVRYLTGFSGSYGLCLVTREDKAFLTDSRYSIQAKSEVLDWKIFDAPTRLKDAINEIGKGKIAKVGVEGDNITCSRYQELKSEFSELEFVVTKSIIEYFRLFKDENELYLIKRAIDIAQIAYSEWVVSVVAGAVEKTLALQLEMAMREGGGENLPFPVIVASGRRSAMPHAAASSKAIEEGDMVVVDFGIRHCGYCSDITRTLLLDRSISKHVEIFDVVKGAQEEVFRYARPGMSCGEVDALARNYIEKAGWGGYFLHGTGHGVGLDVHESPSVGKGRTDIVMEGMVFTVEPGIYHPEIGGVRIEDMVLMGKNGVEVLTSLPLC